MGIKLNGWQRLGIVLSVIWIAYVGAEYWTELNQGPFGHGWLTDTIVTKTGEPISVLNGNEFKDLVPVDQVVNIKRLLQALLVPIILLWALGFLWAWVLRGFRTGRN